MVEFKVRSLMTSATILKNIAQALNILTNILMTEAARELTLAERILENE